MTRLRRFLALVPGNPMNPVTVLVLGFFGLILLGFPPFMRAVGLDTGGIVLVMAIVVLTALALSGLTVHIARRYLHDYEQLIGGGWWVHWRTTAAERAHFVTQEHLRAHRQASQFALFGIGLVLLAGGLMWLYTRTAAGVALGVAVFGAVSLVVVLTTVLWGGARERADAHDLDDIYLGDLGIYHLGRYTPVRGMNLFLLNVALQAGSPSVLQFTVGSRTRYGTVRPAETRVLVPQGREGEAADLVARFHREFKLEGQGA